MKSNLLLATLLTAVLLACSPALAQEPHRHQHEHSGELGRVNFPISCTRAAKQKFNRGVAWLHSFEYEEAEKTFTEVAAVDPRCGMAYWGIAMSNYHPLWAPPLPAELQKGSAAIEKAISIGGPTPREQDYISAMSAFYKDAGRLDHRTRVLAYVEAMSRLHQRYPSDQEAGVFYSLALIAKGTIVNDKTYPNEKQAARILNAVLRHQPRHPGVAHYLIHGYDYPVLAHMALPAARSYAKIAPASAHAQHMPSHIFTRLGLWQEAIRSNLDAHSSARAHAVRNKLPDAWDEQLHAMDYLAYAYLQSAQDKHALRVIDELYGIRRVDPPNFKVAYAFSAIPARYALERRQWSEAAKLPVRPGGMTTFPWENFRWAEAHIRLARAVGAARMGDSAAASKEVERLSEIQRELGQVKEGYDWAKQVEIQRQMASAWLAYSEGKHEEALRMMRSAADLDDATDKHPVTPGAILPAREQVGELLLEMKQPSAALQEFETSLRSSPNRFNGVYGAARAARLALHQRKAKAYYAQLLTLTRPADQSRPEIAEAKSFLADTGLRSRTIGRRR